MQRNNSYRDLGLVVAVCVFVCVLVKSLLFGFTWVGIIWLILSCAYFYIVWRCSSTGKTVKNAKVAILGFTFKENCPDTRNSKVFDVVKELREYGVEPIIVDPIADAAEAKRLYGIDFVDLSEINDMDAIVLAVAHEQFAKFTEKDVAKLFGKGRKVLIDVKGVFNRKEYESKGYAYWRL